jgi:hypothetical protein
MNRFFKVVSVVLVLSLMFQSCAVYRRKSVSLEEAAKTEHRILMIRTNDQKVRLKRIENIDGIYYGLTRVKGEKVKLKLDEKDIKALRPINRGLTTMGNFGIVALSLVAIVVVIFLSYDWDDSYDFDLSERP